MKNIKKTDEKREDRSKDSIRSKEPLVEGRFKRFMRKAALALAISIAPATLTLATTSTMNCGTTATQNVPRPDGEVQEDAEVRDVDADPSDVEVRDARVDANSPDSSVVDASVMDSSVDAAMDSSVQEDANVQQDANVQEDAEVVDAALPDSSVQLDSSVPDAEVDAGPPPVCNGVFVENHPNYLLNYALPAPIGGYLLEYGSYVDPSNLTVNVYCGATSDLVLAGEQFTTGVQKTVYLASGDMNLRMTVTVFDINMALVNASIELP